MLSIIEFIRYGNLRLYKGFVDLDFLLKSRIKIDKTKKWGWRFYYNMTYIIELLHKNGRLRKLCDVERFLVFFKNILNDNIKNKNSKDNTDEIIIVYLTNIVYKLNKLNMCSEGEKYLIKELNSEYKFFMAKAEDYPSILPYIESESVEPFTDNIFTNDFLIKKKNKNSIEITEEFIIGLLERLDFIKGNHKDYYSGIIEPKIKRLTEYYWITLGLKLFCKFYPIFIKKFKEKCYIPENISYQKVLKFDSLCWALYLLPVEISGHFLSTQTNSNNKEFLLKYIEFIAEKGLDKYVEFITSCNQKHIDSVLCINPCGNFLYEDKIADLSCTNKICEYPFSSLVLYSSNSGHLYYFSPYDMNAFNNNRMLNPYNNEIIPNEACILIQNNKKKLENIENEMKFNYFFNCPGDKTIKENLQDLKDCLNI